MWICMCICISSTFNRLILYTYITHRLHHFINWIIPAKFQYFYWNTTKTTIEFTCFSHNTTKSRAKVVQFFSQFMSWIWILHWNQTLLVTDWNIAILCKTFLLHIFFPLLILVWNLFKYHVQAHILFDLENSSHNTLDEISAIKLWIKEIGATKDAIVAILLLVQLKRTVSSGTCTSDSLSTGFAYILRLWFPMSWC